MNADLPPAPGRGLPLWLKVLVGIVGAIVLSCAGVFGFGYVWLRGVIDTYVAEQSRVVSLGMAVAPPMSSPDAGMWHQWRAEDLTPPAHEAGYALAADEAAAVAQAHLRISRELGFRRLDGGVFLMAKTKKCPADLACAYQKLAAHDAQDIAPLTQLFLDHASDAGLDQRALTTLIVTFVQGLRYQIPGPAEPFGIHPPALVAADGWGDCDSKGLLAVMMLQGAGVDAMLLGSEELKHAAVGVAMPGQGLRVASGPRSYLYWEITTPSWPPGKCAPELNKPHLWRAIPLTAAPAPAPPRKSKRDAG